MITAYRHVNHCMGMITGALNTALEYIPTAINLLKNNSSINMYCLHVIDYSYIL